MYPSLIVLEIYHPRIPFFSFLSVMVILLGINRRRCHMDEFVLPLDEEIVDIADFF